MDAWETVGRGCIVEGCTELDKAQNRDKDARRSGFFDQYYACHMARGCCTRYFCPHPKCCTLRKVRRNLESHFIGLQEKAEPKDPTKIVTEADKQMWEEHKGFKEHTSQEIEKVLAALWGPDHQATGYLTPKVKLPSGFT